MREIFNRTKTIEVTPVIDDDAYSAGDVVGGLIELDVASAGGGGVIRRVMLIDDDSEGAALTLYFFDAEPTTIADDAAYAPTVADLKKQIGIVEIATGDYVTQNGNDIVIKDGDDLNIDYESIDGKLYAYIVCTATPTYTAVTDLTLRVTVWMD
jgi:hypothetical protein